MDCEVDEKRTLGQPDTLQRLACALHLRSHSPLTGENARLTSDRQQALAKIFGFSEDPTCMTALSHEDSEEFRNAFFAFRDRTRNKASIRPTIVPRRIDDLLEEDKENREQPPPSPFASLSLWIEKLSTEPGVAYVRPNLNCHTVTTADGITMTLKEAHLKFNLGWAETVQPGDRYGGKEPFASDRAIFSVRDTDASWPSWSIKAKDGRDIGALLDFPDDFIKVQRLAAGDEVRAVLRGYGKEIDISLTFSFKTSREMQQPERKIALLLKRLEILKDDKGGSVRILASGMIRLKAHDKGARSQTEPTTSVNAALDLGKQRS